MFGLGAATRIYVATGATDTVSIHEHIAERAEEFMDSGMSRVDAEQTARREFGNLGLIEQRSREVWQWPTAESLFADVRFALRQLIKSPGFTVTAVASLALGIAVNSTMFSLVSAFLLPHLPGREPQSCVVVSSVNPDASFQADTNPISPPNYSAWGNDRSVFSEVTAANEYLTGSLSGSEQQPEAISYAAVSANYFSVFGVAPQLGLRSRTWSFMRIRSFVKGDPDRKPQDIAEFGAGKSMS
jgi:putative ABC transport system permease protein